MSWKLPNQSCPCVTLSSRQLYMVSRCPSTPINLYKMQKPLIESKGSHSDAMNVKYADVDRTWPTYDVITTRAGPVGVGHLCGFSWILRRRFWYTCSYITSAHVVKMSDPGLSRSDHQVKSSYLTWEKVWMLVIATSTEWSPWNFQRWIWRTVSIKFIHWIFISVT